MREFGLMWIYSFVIGATVLYFIDGSRLELTVNDAESGLFMRESDPVRTTESLSRGWDSTEYTVTPIVRPGRLSSIRAQYADIASTQPVGRALLREALNTEQHSLTSVYGSVDISAHVVIATISADRPILQVAFHAGILPAAKLEANLRHETEGTNRGAVRSQPAADDIRRGKIKTTRGETDGKSPSTASPETKYCLTARAVKDGEHVSGTCVLSAKSGVCMTEATLPLTWWHAERADSARVLYHVKPLDIAGDVCVENDTLSAEEFQTITTVKLLHGQMTYEELKEDQNVLIYVPQASFYPGSRFRVPIKLQAASSLKIFIMKVRARHGVKIVGAEVRNNSAWNITLDLNHKLHGAMVTAHVNNVSEHMTAADRVTDVFEWLFEVDDSATGDDRARINFVVEYELNAHHKETYRSVENRIAARIEIQRDNTYAIVPIIKTTELINTAVLTGKVLNYPMRIYSVSHLGRLSDVTSQTTCHCADEHVLKVVESCNWVYMDGSETKGSSSVTIITKYGRHTKFLFFKVWMPEFPLNIHLSDAHLSLIKGWKIPNLRNGKAASDSTRKSRAADYGILSSPSDLLPEEGTQKEELTSSCETRYQSTVVQVFTSFTMTDSEDVQYLGGANAQYSISSLVLHQMKVIDQSIAKLDGDIVTGLATGVTELQIVFNNGEILGSTELSVGSDRVSVEGLDMSIISGLTLSLESRAQQRSISARITAQHVLTHNNQEAYLDITILFDDGTSFPLDKIEAADYYLKVDTLNNHVVSFGSPYGPATPKVIALGPGKGELLKVALELSDSCQRKKSRPVSAGYVYVDVEMTSQGSSNPSEKNVQSDSAQYGYDRWGSRRDSSLHLSVAAGKSKDSDKLSVSQVLFKSSDDSRNDGTEMSPLEISMYSLLAVFCAAVVVFSINCAIFVMRYRRKKGSGEVGFWTRHSVLRDDVKDPVNCAPDWVWIGRDTLERNAINTACSQALMSDADFNGNHSSDQRVSTFHCNRNSAGGIVCDHTAGVSDDSFIAGVNMCCNPGAANGNIPEERKGNSFIAGGIMSDPKVPERSTPEGGKVETGEFVEELNKRHSYISTAHLRAECESLSSASSAASSPTPEVGFNQPDSNANLLAAAHSDPWRQSENSSGVGLNQRQSAERGADSSSLDERDRRVHRDQSQPLTREEHLRRVEEALASGSSDVEWDCDELGMTYGQVMDYFDNLKESTA